MICYITNFVLWVLGMCITSVIYVFGFEPKNANRWKNALGIILVQLPFLIIKYLFNTDALIRNFGLIMTAASCILYLIIFFEGYTWQKLLFVMFNAVCSFTAEMITQLTLNDDLNKLGELSFDSPIMVKVNLNICIIQSLLFLFFLFVWKQFFSRGSYNLKIFFVFSIFPISQIIMMESINSRIYQDFTPRDIVTILGLFVGVVADILLLVTLLKQQNMQEMSIKLNEIEKAWEIEQNHYREIETRREELAKIRHDLSEQFIVIQELLHRENYDKAQEMLDTLKESVTATKEYTYCADPVVNAIMAENEKICLKNNIRLDYNLEILQPLKMNPVVVCSIFSNLMRNAVAAASKCENSQNAFVSIRAAVKGDYLHIKVENTCVDQQKKDIDNRKGYGLNILKTIADKYNGQMEIVAAQGKYSTRISVENIEETEKSSSL